MTLPLGVASLAGLIDKVKKGVMLGRPHAGIIPRLPLVQ